ncbi:MAG: hypothetical protein P8P15_08185 [Polaribacter sp.]|nr:hypothetical protein [Polaribacter sp.]
MLGHRLQLMPFFLYLLQHLLFGVIQLAEQTLSQTDVCVNSIVGVLGV